MKERTYHNADSRLLWYPNYIGRGWPFFHDQEIIPDFRTQGVVFIFHEALEGLFMSQIIAL